MSAFPELHTPGVPSGVPVIHVPSGETVIAEVGIDYLLEDGAFLKIPNYPVQEGSLLRILLAGTGTILTPQDSTLHILENKYGYPISKEVLVYVSGTWVTTGVRADPVYQNYQGWIEGATYDSQHLITQNRLDMCFSIQTPLSGISLTLGYRTDNAHSTLHLYSWNTNALLSLAEGVSIVGIGESTTPVFQAQSGQHGLLTLVHMGNNAWQVVERRRWNEL